MNFTPDDAVLVAIASLLASLLAWLRAGRSEKATQKLEHEKVEILRRIAGLYGTKEDVAANSGTALQALAGRLLTQLLTLPYPDPNDQHLREAVLWTEPDLERLEDLASQQGAETAGLAARAVPKLQFLSRVVSNVQAIDPRLGYDYRQFPKDRWQDSFRAGREALHLLTNPNDPTSGATLDIHLTGERIYIDNVGDLPAHDVNLDVVAHEDGGRSPLVANDVSRKLPVAELPPGDSCPLMAAISNDCAPPFTATLTWTDTSCAAGERRELRKILYRH